MTVQKAFLKGKKPDQVYLSILVNFHAPGQIRIPNTDPDPGQPNQCRFISIIPDENICFQVFF